MCENKIKISIAICTYNGANYIKEELESMLNQTLLPDEIIIFDDCSTDRTVELILEVKSKTNVLIHLHQNDSNVGLIENFVRCAKSCQGDIIFFADQDDIWKENKIERIMKEFNKSAEVQLVFTNATILNQREEKISSTLWDSLDIYPTNNQNQLFLDLIKTNSVTGATMALRKTAFLNSVPIPNLWVHDEWFAFSSLFLGTVVALNEELMHYRVHQDNLIGVTENDLNFKKKRFLNDLSKVKEIRLEKYTKLSSLYHYQQQLNINSRRLAILKQAVDFYCDEKNLFSLHYFNRIKIILKHIMLKDYWKFSSGFPTIIKDIILLFRRTN